MRNKRPVSGRLMFALIALAASAGFVRLGLWQLDRHTQVTADNEARRELLALAPVPLNDATLDSLSVEVIVRNRAHAGSPGVHVVTPLTLDGSPETGPPPTVLVLRGWLPANSSILPRENTHAIPAVGRDEPRLALVEASRSGLGEPVVEVSDGDEAVRSYAALDVALIAGPDGGMLPFFLQLLPAESGTVPADQPIAVPLPELDAGPHMGYAIQWFSFAVITIVGTAAFLRRRVAG
jgi:surfeit locus 1 family protein